MERKLPEPKYYRRGKFEPIDVIEDWKLPYHLGCVLKYLGRYRFKHKKKEHQKEDLKKAAWYLLRYIDHLQKGK